MMIEFLVVNIKMLASRGFDAGANLPVIDVLSTIMRLALFNTIPCAEWRTVFQVSLDYCLTDSM